MTVVLAPGHPRGLVGYWSTSRCMHAHKTEEAARRCAERADRRAAKAQRP